MAATEAGRPTESGRNSEGNSTVLRIGSTGSVFSTTEGFSFSGFTLVLRPDADPQHPLLIFGGDVRGFEVARQFDAALEGTVDDFQTIVGAALLFGTVAALAAYGQAVAARHQLKVVGPHARQLKLDEPAGARAA